MLWTPPYMVCVSCKNIYLPYIIKYIRYNLKCQVVF
nr:MAG TPA: hypothetical protein [Bacteriophage sp.]